MNASRRATAVFLAGVLLHPFSHGAEATPAPPPGNLADEIARLAGELGHADFKIRQAAEERLMEIGRADPAPILLDLPIGAADPEVRARVRVIQDALAEEFSNCWEHLLAEADTPRLLRLLENEKPDLRRAALWVLGLRGDPSARPAIERMGSDEDADVAEAPRADGPDRLRGPLRGGGVIASS